MGIVGNLAYCLGTDRRAGTEVQNGVRSNAGYGIKIGPVSSAGDRHRPSQNDDRKDQ